MRDNLMRLSALLMLLGALSACDSSAVTTPTPQAPVETPTPSLTETDLTFAWTDAGSGWSPLAVSLEASTRRVSFSRYGGGYSGAVIITEAELEQLLSLSHEAGIYALAEATVVLDDETCCQTPGYWATMRLSSPTSIRTGGRYWTADTEDDALALLRTYVQRLVNAYADALPPSEYVFDMVQVGGIAGIQNQLMLNAMTGAVHIVMDDEELTCQATPAQMLMAQSLLLDPGLWLLKEEYGTCYADAVAFCVDISPGGSMHLTSGTCELGAAPPVMLALNSLNEWLWETCF